MRAGLGIVLGVVVEVHAHVLFQVAAALAHEPAGSPAGAGTDRDGPGVLNELVHLVVACFAGIVLDGTLHRDDAHQVHANVHKRRQHGHPFAGIALKALAQHGILVALLPVGEHALHNSRHPDGVVPAESAIHHAAADDASDLELIQLLLRKRQILLGAMGDLLCRAVGLQAHVHHDRTHVVINNGLQQLIFRVVVSDACVCQAFQTDLGRQF